MAKQPQKQGQEEKPVITAGSSDAGLQEEVLQVQDDSAVVELRRQLEALRQSEQAARTEAQAAAQQRDQALRYAQQRDAELNRSRRETTDSRMDAITSGMAAAEAEIEEAKQAFRAAAVEQDIDAQVAAQERLAKANANLVNLSNGKTALEQAIKQAEEQAKLQAAQQAQQRQQAPQGDALDRTNLPQTAKNWLRAHPDYLTDQRKNAKIQSLHWDVVDEGHAPFSDAYYESLEQHLGMRAKPKKSDSEEENEDDSQRTIVSAPVSRETPGRQINNPKEIRLTVSQKEAAKMAGISEVEYAKQLIELNKAKANGSYGGQP